MNIKFKKFQQGGEMPMAEEQPQVQEQSQAQPQENQDPLMMLAEMAAQALQSQDCNVAMQVCQGFIEVLQSAQQGAAPETEPVYRKGGILVKRIKK